MTPSLYNDQNKQYSRLSNKYLHDDEHIDGVFVFTQSARNEAVVVRVHDGRVQNAINFDKTALLIELVLHLASFADLNDLQKQQSSVKVKVHANDSNFSRSVTYHVENGRCFRTCKQERNHSVTVH